METDELILRLAADRHPSPSLARDLALSAAAALAAGGLLILALWGPRPDLPEAVSTPAFWMKTAYTVALAAAGLVILERLARPGERSGIGMALAGLAVALTLMLAARELTQLPARLWMADMKGHTWRVCPVRIALAATPGFLLLFWRLRGAAPTRPRLAGAAAGLLAGGLGATVYGLHCDETAAAFLAVWYTLGVLVWAAVGAVAGPRLLRW